MDIQIIYNEFIDQLFHPYQPGFWGFGVLLQSYGNEQHIFQALIAKIMGVSSTVSSSKCSSKFNSSKYCNNSSINSRKCSSNGHPAASSASPKSHTLASPHHTQPLLASLHLWKILAHHRASSGSVPSVFSPSISPYIIAASSFISSSNISIYFLYHSDLPGYGHPLLPSVALGRVYTKSPIRYGDQTTPIASTAQLLL